MEHLICWNVLAANFFPDHDHLYIFTSYTLGLSMSTRMLYKYETSHKKPSETNGLAYLAPDEKDFVNLAAAPTQKMPPPYTSREVRRRFLFLFH